MSSTIITVFGATGAQGGSVVHSLLANKSNNFKVRGITRNSESEKAKALSALGVEIIQADGLIKEQMTAALKGSWGLFVNTNSDDSAINKPDGPTELDFGKGVIDAAHDAGVQHLVYSGMESASKITNGAVPNKAFDEKHAVGEYAKTKGFASVTIVSAAWYMENYLGHELAAVLGGFPFEKDEDGYLTMHVPRWGGNEEVPFIAMGQDFGDIVHGIFLDPQKYNGRFIQGISESKSLEGVVKTFEKVTGKKSRFVAVEDWKDMETYGAPELETLKNMFGFCQHSGGLYYGEPNDVALAAELKESAVAAQGLLGNEAKLFTVEEFFGKHFSS